MEWSSLRASSIELRAKTAREDAWRQGRNTECESFSPVGPLRPGFSRLFAERVEQRGSAFSAARHRERDLALSDPASHALRRFCAERIALVRSELWACAPQSHAEALRQKVVPARRGNDEPLKLALGIGPQGTAWHNHENDDALGPVERAMRFTRIAASIGVLSVLGCGQTTRDRPGVGAEAGTGGTGGRGAGGGSVGGGGARDVGRCEPSGPAVRGPDDPGKAGTEYGPLMGGPVIVDDQVMQSTGTAAAVAVASGSHLFYTTRPTDELSEVYISIVVADPAWAPGVYSAPIGGALDITTHADCRYYLDLARLEKDSLFRLEVTESHAQGSDFYLKGRLDAELPSQNGGTALSLNFTIN